MRKLGHFWEMGSIYGRCWDNNLGLLWYRIFLTDFSYFALIGWIICFCWFLFLYFSFHDHDVMYFLTSWLCIYFFDISFMFSLPCRLPLKPVTINNKLFLLVDWLMVLLQLSMFRIICFDPLTLISLSNALLHCLWCFFNINDI